MGWLNDELINAGQRLIKRQFPHVNGLQDVAIGNTLCFDIQTEEFIQVLHTGKNHWVTVSTIGCKDGEIFVYNSQTSSLTTSLTKQIVSLLATPKKNITVMYVYVQCRMAIQIVAFLLLPLLQP